MSGRGRPCDEAVIASTQTGDPCAGRVKRFVLAATIIGSGMAFIDSAAVGVALPVIGTDLGVSLPVMQWVVNGYVLVSAALTLIGGAAGDRFGRRRVFLLGIVVFTAASCACGLGTGAVALIAARIAQGAGGALMVPNSLAIIGAAFGKSEKGKAIGTWAGASSIASALGPVLGGWLTDTVSWRAIFFINVPFAVLAALIAWARLPESRDPQAAPRLDWPGAALAACGLAALAFAFIEAGPRGWHDPLIVISAGAGVLVLALFLLVEARGAAPMVPLGLFRSSRFSGINLLTLLLYGALGGALFLLPFDLIRVQSYKAAEAGAAFLPFPLIMFSLSRWSGGLLDRFGARLPLVVGPLLTAVGLGLFAVGAAGGSYWVSVFPPMVITSLGMAVSVAPLTAAVMSAVPDRQVGIASGVNNAVADIASLLAVSVFGAVGLAVFARVFDSEIASIAAGPELSETIEAIKRSLAGAEFPADLSEQTRAQLESSIATSFAASFRLLMLVAAGLAALSAAVAALTIPRGAVANAR
ncbi:MAG TPA: MFS transporter [Stellaceae bacterium]|nr:MFS transporter [Stellaceae bacterium]